MPDSLDASDHRPAASMASRPHRASFHALADLMSAGRTARSPIGLATSSRQRSDEMRQIAAEHGSVKAGRRLEGGPAAAIDVRAIDGVTSRTS